MRIQPATDSTLLASLKRIAPGTTIREGIDDIIRAQLGALIVVGEPSRLSFLFSGGMRLDVPLTAQHLYELAKLDGAIIIDSAMTRLVYANVQLMPDPKIPSAESGTRHRTAERVAKQTDALLISISQQRETVTLFLGDHRYQLGLISDVLARMNQALATLGTYRQRLDHALTRLTALEFRGAAALDDVLVVLQRAELATRMAEEIEASCAELGQEGRLVRLQLEDLMDGVPREKAAVIFDYVAESEPGRAMGVLEQLGKLSFAEIFDLPKIVELLGHGGEASPADVPVEPRGFRVLSRIPRLPEGIVRQVVRDLGCLSAILEASHQDLERVEGVGAVRAREIREGLRRLQEQNVLDWHLQP